MRPLVAKNSSVDTCVDGEGICAACFDIQIEDQPKLAVELLCHAAALNQKEQRLSELLLCHVKTLHAIVRKPVYAQPVLERLHACGRQCFINQTHCDRIDARQCVGPGRQHCTSGRASLPIPCRPRRQQVRERKVVVTVTHRSPRQQPKALSSRMRHPVSATRARNPLRRQPTKWLAECGKSKEPLPGLLP